MKKTFNIHQFGPWALITGASSGIGREFARQLASGGINVVLVARRKKLLEELGKELEHKYGIRYRTVEADMSNEKAFDKIRSITDPLDIGLVISNAGTGAPGEFIRLQPDNLLKMVQTSVVAHLKIAHHFGNRLADKRRGGIVLVSAMGAADGLPFMANDAGTRAYIRSFGLGLHTELKRYGVHVTVLVPSPTDTPVVAHLGFSAEKMPMKLLSVEQCVREALHALEKNRPSIIPGFMYRLMDAIVPSSLSRKMFAKMLAEGNGIKLKVT
ncbi:SDR family NAD(P)-dependent oxidoreductase [Fulvivirga ulvae]|uniref:SDR family NAD(P)-dependent oxidoreductase n=1 Tax=Fulvivirga ulvae TaxID=2904245 RepID=UPI001F19F44D|nr:SDR family NAD(P)-dependent oxidoreductase [Fulvivirga ulvae]UII32042.1 SDR family NAD(P)-dependent oxidoreductase [Fulvivirga ulvae]